MLKWPDGSCYSQLSNVLFDISINLHNQLYDTVNVDRVIKKPQQEFERMCINFENAHYDIGF